MKRRLWDREGWSISLEDCSLFALQPQEFQPKRCCSHPMTPNNWGKPKLKGKQLCNPFWERGIFSSISLEPYSRHSQAIEQRDTYKPPQSSICRGPWRTRIRCKRRARNESLASSEDPLTAWEDFSPQ